MRTYGRVTNSDGAKTWKLVETDSTGSNDYVYITTLIQVFKLNLGESPFYANYGIPAHNSVLQQTHPDYYMSRTQQQFSQYFASLIITAAPSVGPDFKPVYNVNLITHYGVPLEIIAQ